MSFIIEETRGARAESTHAVSVAIVDDGGKLVASSGDASRPTFMRSAAKPFQAIPLVADGVLERFALHDEHLALACASHSSEPEHVRLVRQMLDHAGCRESDLVCGPHRPLSVTMAVRPPNAPAPQMSEPRGGVYSNCSGKHAGMLALAVHHGWPPVGYERPGHPVQRRCRDEIARWTGVADTDIGEAVDGCGVVCFLVPLDRMAGAFARLGTSDDPAASRVAKAMTTHPHLVAGQYRLCTELMAAYPGEILAKVGAAGVYGVSLPNRGLGVALKVEDGDARAAMVALVAVLEQLGLDPSPRETLERFATMPIHNTRGAVVGEMRAGGVLTYT